MRILLLRHGQYRREPREVLTVLGRRQARRAGKRLREEPVHEIHCSTMPRACETATIVRRVLGGGHRVREWEELRECVPGFPRRGRRKFGIPPEAQLRRDRRQAEAAFRRFFAKPRGKRTVLLVCHGNIIRYLVCRVVGMDPALWVNLDVNQCGLTVVEWSSRKKRLELISFNDVGHLPKAERTFT